MVLYLIFRDGKMENKSGKMVRKWFRYVLLVPISFVSSESSNKHMLKINA